MHHDFGSVVAQRVDRTPVIAMALRDDDGLSRAGNVGEGLTPRRTLKDHTGIDDDTAVVGGHGVGVGHTGRHPDVVAQRFSGIARRGFEISRALALPIKSRHAVLLMDSTASIVRARPLQLASARQPAAIRRHD